MSGQESDNKAVSNVRISKSLRIFRLIGLGASPAPHCDAQHYIAEGDQHRSRLSWPAAAEAYHKALSLEPGRHPIWIQLGHALKEQGKFAEAQHAYLSAAKLRPHDAEAHGFLGYLTKDRGLLELATRHYLQAIHSGGYNPNIDDELIWVINERRRHDKGALADIASFLRTLEPRDEEPQILRDLRNILAHSPTTSADSLSEPMLVFDISDLVAYFDNARLPTGIQRVQIEVVQGALAAAASNVHLCCIANGRDDWVEVPLDHFETLARLSVTGADRSEPVWRQALQRLKFILHLDHAFSFARGSTLVNLGTSWWIQNYFLFVREAKASSDIRYVPFVHDMIPIMHPQHCVKELVQDFIAWTIGVFDHADAYLVNSRATKLDLLAVARDLGRAVDENMVAVVPLDADCRKIAESRLPASHLSKWGLERTPFILFVSTIESRKGHLVAFEAWSLLATRMGSHTPKLVCVGNRGWLNSMIYSRLEDPQLADNIIMLSGLTDDELALLYRHCLFTTYPSLYEGWGLPVTESLCYGKVPLISDAASLPEAGGGFAVYATAGSADELADRAEGLIADDGLRSDLEKKIHLDYAPRSWLDVAMQIGTDIERLLPVGSLPKKPRPMAEIGAWHDLSRNRSLRIWRGYGSAECYRSGLNWQWPDRRGCAIRHGRATLSFTLPKHSQPLRIYVLFLGDVDHDCEWSITAKNHSVANGQVEAKRESWGWIDFDASNEPHLVELVIEGACPALETPSGQSGLKLSLAGFFICEGEIETARSLFLERVTLGRLDTLDRFREGAPTFQH